jgi:hypothetical protein
MKLPDLDLPPEESVIWRFMDFPKFVAMVHKGGIHFCRADELGDPFEGSYTPESLQAFTCFVGDDKEKAEEWREIIKHLRLNTYISCWHVSPGESAALWRLYGNAVAIRSTSQRLRAFLGGSEIEVGLVRYIDYENDHPSIRHSIEPFFYKRSAFKHEQELRAAYQYLTYEGSTWVPDDSPGLPGEWKAGDLNQLIDSVVVSPTAPDWFRELTFEVGRKLGLNVVCYPSRLNVSPFF